MPLVNAGPNGIGHVLPPPPLFLSFQELQEAVTDYGADPEG
jgi:hypothetical protein